jgi:hypothetical protein
MEVLANRAITINLVLIVKTPIWAQLKVALHLPILGATKGNVVYTNRQDTTHGAKQAAIAHPRLIDRLQILVPAIIALAAGLLTKSTGSLLSSVVSAHL